jgi:hypothetical protein
MYVTILTDARPMINRRRYRGCMGSSRRTMNTTRYVQYTLLYETIVQFSTLPL